MSMCLEKAQLLGDVAISKQTNKHRKNFSNLTVALTWDDCNCSRIYWKGSRHCWVTFFTFCTLNPSPDSWLTKSLRMSAYFCLFLRALGNDRFHYFCASPTFQSFLDSCCMSLIHSSNVENIPTYIHITGNSTCDLGLSSFVFTETRIIWTRLTRPRNLKTSSPRIQIGIRRIETQFTKTDLYRT